MISHLLFEHPKRGELLRVSIDTFKGRTYANFRTWYGKPGALKPTRQGATIPRECLDALHASLGAYLRDNPLSGPENGS